MYGEEVGNTADSLVSCDSPGVCTYSAYGVCIYSVYSAYGLCIYMVTLQGLF